MKRHLLNFAIFFSLLLAVVTVVFWFRSTTREDVAGGPFWPRSHYAFFIRSDYGLLQFDIYPNNSGCLAFSLDYFRIRPNQLLVWQTQFDFDTVGSVVTDTPPHLWVPHWFVAMLLMILPMYWVVMKLRRRKRIETGMCQQCGYDLRATPERCPECGTAIVLVKPV